MLFPFPFSLFRCPKAFRIVADMAIGSKSADDTRLTIRHHRGIGNGNWQETSLPLPPSDPTMKVSALLLNISHHCVPL